MGFGPHVLRRKVSSPLDAHDVLVGGLPGAALTHLVGHLTALRKPDSLEKAVGMSLQTVGAQAMQPAAAD